MCNFSSILRLSPMLLSRKKQFTHHAKNMIYGLVKSSCPPTLTLTSRHPLLQISDMNL